MIHVWPGYWRAHFIALVCSVLSRDDDEATIVAVIWRCLWHTGANVNMVIHPIGDSWR